MRPFFSSLPRGASKAGPPRLRLTPWPARSSLRSERLLFPVQVVCSLLERLSPPWSGLSPSHSQGIARSARNCGGGELRRKEKRGGYLPLVSEAPIRVKRMNGVQDLKNRHAACRK